MWGIPVRQSVRGTGVGKLGTDRAQGKEEEEEEGGAPLCRREKRWLIIFLTVSPPLSLCQSVSQSVSLSNLLAPLPLPITTFYSSSLIPFSLSLFLPFLFCFLLFSSPFLFLSRLREHRLPNLAHYCLAAARDLTDSNRSDQSSINIVLS